MAARQCTGEVTHIDYHWQTASIEWLGAVGPKVGALSEVNIGWHQRHMWPVGRQLMKGSDEIQLSHPLLKYVGTRDTLGRS